MLEFLSLNLATIAVAAVVAILVILIAAGLVKDRKKGRSSCGSACAGCPNAAMCHAQHDPSKDR